LANGLLRQDVVHEQRRRLGHPPRAAARAEAAALARKCHQLLGLAAVALDPHKTMLEQTALEISLELIFNVPRQRPPLGCPPIPKPGIVLGHEKSSDGRFRKSYRPVRRVKEFSGLFAGSVEALSNKKSLIFFPGSFVIRETIYGVRVHLPDVLLAPFC